MSFVLMGLAGLSRFIVLTGAFCLAMIIAITGPPTRSETAGLSTVMGHAVRRLDTAALHFTFDLCDNVPIAAHAAGLCASPEAALVRAQPQARTLHVAAVSETLPAAGSAILPPDTLDQIARPPHPRAVLLGEGPPAPRIAHPRPQHASVTAGRMPRARGRHAARASAHREGRTAHTHTLAADTHLAHARAAAPSAHNVHAAPISAPHRPSPPPVQPVSASARAPAPPPTASAPPTESAPAANGSAQAPGEARPVASGENQTDAPAQNQTAAPAQAPGGGQEGREADHAPNDAAPNDAPPNDAAHADPPQGEDAEPAKDDKT